MKTTPQQDRLLIALTRNHLPRTVENLSVETRIPRPSVRRTLAELRAKGSRFAYADMHAGEQ